MISNKTAQSNAKSAVKAQIDENLRRAYDEVLTEAIPDRFTQLLAQLRGTGGSAPQAPASEDAAATAQEPQSSGTARPPAQTPNDAKTMMLGATDHATAPLSQSLDQDGKPPEGPR